MTVDDLRSTYAPRFEAKQTFFCRRHGSTCSLDYLITKVMIDHHVSKLKKKLKKPEKQNQS